MKERELFSEKGSRACIRYAALAISAILLSGCVAKGMYDRDVRALNTQLQFERTENTNRIKSLESRLQDRGKSLTEVTNRYITLEKDKEQLQVRINHLRDDLEALMRDMAELRMVIDANLKGSSASEMKVKLNEMRQRVQKILGSQNEPLGN